MLGMMTLMPSVCFAHNDTDSVTLHRIWNYRRNYTTPLKGHEHNVYMRYVFDVEKRNFLLWLVPTMYVVAKGDRQYISESYCKLRFRDVDDYEVHRQIICGTIPRHRTAMPPLLEFTTPDFYDVTLYPDHCLSPFHHANRIFYYYHIDQQPGDCALVHFRPRTPNTQLVTGHAVVNNTTGQLQSVQLEGEFDMISFKVSALMSKDENYSQLPERCSTDAVFHSAGNRIKANLLTVYNCPETLPDSIRDVKDRARMEQLRPVPLTPNDMNIYRQYDEKVSKSLSEEPQDTVKRHDWLKEIGWDIIGYNLIKGNKTDIGHVTMHVSPLLNPLYFGYSHSHGLSYKLKFGLQYTWNSHRFLTLKPEFGYNFKLNQIFYTVPLRMNYNPKRNGYAELKWANGNHTSNSILENDFRERMKDSINMPEYKDMLIQAINNVMAFDWLEITSGLIFHKRTALDRNLMKAAGLDDEFRSFGPMLTVKLSPWYDGPTLTANYERGMNMFGANLTYGRWEFDASYLHRMKCMRILNLRAGTGFYTHRSSNYFADYTNFRDNNLPTGWEDDWSGQFQLLNSRWYNESDYYFRGHASYESPLLALSHMPLIGHYIESERLYISALSIQHTRPYFEVGYGLSNRLFSIGLFGSFLGSEFQKFGCKVTVELFRRW